MKNSNQNQTSLKQKGLLIAFGFLIAFLTVEILFRVIGFIAYETKINADNNTSRNNIKILCVGDSSTFGVGASVISKYSYPNQLQQILTQNYPDAKYHVINQGIPGASSSQLANRFKKNILKYKPDIVVAQIGANDSWNLEESNIEKHYKESFLNKVLLGAELALNYSKVFMFFKLVSISSNTNDSFSNEDIENELAVIKRVKGKDFKFSFSNLGKTLALLKTMDENIAKIVNISRSHDLPIIFMRYHVGGYRDWHFYQEQVFMQLNVPYVNNRSLFLEAKERGLNPFGSDKWHPGDIGYTLIARNLYNKMVELKLVSGNQIDIFESTLQ